MVGVNGVNVAHKMGGGELHATKTAGRWGGAVREEAGGRVGAEAERSGARGEGGRTGGRGQGCRGGEGGRGSQMGMPIEAGMPARRRRRRGQEAGSGKREERKGRRAP